MHSDTPPAPAAVLLDLEGTLYAKGEAIAGASEAVAELRRMNLGLRFLTNTDSRRDAQVLESVRGYGLELSPDELFTPLAAARRLLGSAPRARTYALVSRALREDVPAVSDRGPYTHVLVGDCRDTLDYAALDGAFRAVLDGAELLALQRGRYFKRTDGDHLDTGAIVAALEYAAGVEARVLGKPENDFFALAARSLGTTPGACVVVGDDATTDIAGGRSVGAPTVQVRTGKYADQVAQDLVGGADREIGSIAELPGLLRQWVSR